MGAVSIRSCPKCKNFTLQRDYCSNTQLYVCRKCGFAANAWNLTTGSLYTPPAERQKPNPKPTSFTRTKTKKPTKAQLEALSAAIGE